MSINPADHSILEPLANRWSPYRFDSSEIDEDKLVRCFEASRWAASSFNDQPWFWIVARRQDSGAFSKMLGCLGQPNQEWASNAGVLILSVIRTTFLYNGKPNRVALHDLGQAAAYFALQAVTLGLQVHQMAGVDLARVRHEYGVPDGFEPQTAIALGHPDTSTPDTEQSQQWQQREQRARQRKPLSDQVYGGKWGEKADFVS